MSFGEKGAWVTAAVLVAAYAWYVAAVVVRWDGGPVSEVVYQNSALFAAIAVVVLVAATHIVLAGSAGLKSSNRASGSNAIRRYTRSTGSNVVKAGAVLGMCLSMVEAEHFWISNVILVALVIAELASASAEILYHRRQSRDATV